MKRCCSVLLATICLYSTFSFLSNDCSAQSQISSQEKVGEVHLNQPTSAKKLLDIDRQINDSLQSIQGFRIQIFLGTGGEGRKNSQEIIEEFREKHPDIPAYDPVEFPNFKVRVGDCRNQLQALKLLAYLKNEYPNAYIVNEAIDLPPLEKPQWEVEYDQLLLEKLAESENKR